ncbi:MAG: hypothetical protein IPK50_18185 [Fibrobacterota bacterium]|nr:MAG: hypothetical protein IPK50_18185 [Fibrobacterota bacterium]
MRKLPDMVLRKTLFVGVVPVLIVSLATLVMLVRHGVRDAVREADFEAARSKSNLDHSIEILESKWVGALRADFRPQSDLSDHSLLRRWIDQDSGVCLVSVWQQDSLAFSHPRRDEIPPGELTRGGWSDVETNPRCAGPVVRFAFDLGFRQTALIAFRLNPLWTSLSTPLQYPGSRTSLLDRRGLVVGDQSPSLAEVVESDPIIARVSKDSVQSSGWRLEQSGLFSFGSRKLSGPPWWVVVRQDVFSTLAPLAPLGVVVLAMLGLAAWLALMLARSSTVLILEPLVQLRNSLSALEEGEFEGELEPGDIFEINQLANTYNRMALAIHQRESIRMRELETMVSELESFSYSVSHDLRTPLRSIQGFARILLEDELERLSPEGAQSLQRIQVASSRMGLLIDDLLRLAHAARTPLRWELIEMDHLVADVLQELRPLIGNRTIRWFVEPLGTCQGDLGLIRQVWSNLLSNAIKYSQKIPVAEIRISQIRSESGEPWWWVQDNGIGFDPQLTPKLFGVFQRLHAASDFEGTGVGLALVRRIVERHGGQVRAQGEPDMGAKIGFSMPQL